MIRLELLKGKELALVKTNNLFEQEVLHSDNYPIEEIALKASHLLRILPDVKTCLTFLGISDERIKFFVKCRLENREEEFTTNIEFVDAFSNKPIDDLKKFYNIQ